MNSGIVFLLSSLWDVSVEQVCPKIITNVTGSRIQYTVEFLDSDLPGAGELSLNGLLESNTGAVITVDGVAEQHEADSAKYGDSLSLDYLELYPQEEPSISFVGKWHYGGRANGYSTIVIDVKSNNKLSSTGASIKIWGFFKTYPNAKVYPINVSSTPAPTDFN